MGWLIAILLTLIACVLIIIMGRLPRHMWSMPFAAGALALAGYAHQGNPDLAASHATEMTDSNSIAKQLISIRQEMDYGFGAAKRYLILSDSSANNADYKFASAVLQNGLTKYPNDAELWGAFGLQLMLASDGKLTDPAKLAFSKSRESWPEGPVPDYYEGLAALLDGNIDKAESYWDNMLKNGSKNAKWRPRVERQLLQLRGLKQLESQPKP